MCCKQQNHSIHLYMSSAFAHTIYTVPLMPVGSAVSVGVRAVTML